MSPLIQAQMRRPPDPDWWSAYRPHVILLTALVGALFAAGLIGGWCG